MSSAPKDTGRLMAHALTSAQKVVDSDTEVSTIDLQLLANLNTNQFLNYIKLDQQLGALEKNTENLTKCKEEISQLAQDLSAIERQVDVLVNVSDELSAWCNELATSNTKR